MNTNRFFYKDVESNHFKTNLETFLSTLHIVVLISALA